MKKYFRKIHQWLGLTSGLLVFIIAITGAIYAFQKEIQDATQPYRFVEKENRPFLLPSQIEKIAKTQLPGKTLHSIKYHTDNRSAEAIFYHYNPTYYYIIYLNPYTGSILHTQDMQSGFFPFILKGHFYLWLPEKIGQPVVAIATLVFLLMMITGIILWFPKNKKIWKSRTRFKWKATTQWKRKNFDLHAIIGFYSFFIALIFVITGLVWGFRWFAYGYYKTMGGTKTLTFEELKSNKITTRKTEPTDYLYTKILEEKRAMKSIEIHPPETELSSIAINTNTDEGTYWKTDYRYYDQYTLQEIPVNNLYSRFHHAGFADKLMRMNYDLHTGAVLGIAGKIFMFFMSLLIASLPITGFLFWYGRQKKKTASSK